MFDMNSFSQAEKLEYAQYRSQVAHKLHQEAMRKLFKRPQTVEITVTFTITTR